MDTAGPSESALKPARTIALVAAIALLWLATRRYFGTVFDARFYMVEALHQLHPTAFARDLYFQFGSQGNFSVFTRLYLPLLPAFGIAITSIILTIAGQLLWLCGLFLLARRLVGVRTLWLSMAVVIGMLPMYAGGFTYGEAYVTARLFAEAFVMMGLSQLFDRPLRAAALLLLSAAIHPLMALPGIAIAFVYLALGQPRWWWVMAGGAGLAAGLGLAGIAPFANLFRTIDPQWFAIIKARSVQVLLASWPADYFVQVCTAIGWALAAFFLAGPRHRRFLAAALVVGVCGMACAWLGGDVAHNALAIAVQPWRSMWLLQLVSRLYVPVIVAALLARTSLDSSRWTVVLTVALIASACVARLLRYSGAVDFTLLCAALAIAGLAILATCLLITRDDWRVVMAAVVGVALIPVALSQWDARSRWIKYLESSEPPPAALSALLPAGASVYWEGGLEMLWLRLKRASYFSYAQGTRAMFYRDTAMAYQHRADSFCSLRTDDFGQTDACTVSPVPARNRQGLQTLCRREPGLDLIVLSTPLDGVAPKVWQSPVRFQDLQSLNGRYPAHVTDRFYIYSCAPVR